MEQIRPSEVSELLRKEIEGFQSATELEEVFQGGTHEIHYHDT